MKFAKENLVVYERQLKIITPNLSVMLLLDVTFKFICSWKYRYYLDKAQQNTLRTFLIKQQYKGEVEWLLPDRVKID